MDTFSKINEGAISHNLTHLRQIIFEVTDACNLRCKYCAYSDLYEGYDERENSKFPFHRAKLVIDYMYNYWSKAIPQGTSYPVAISFYGGEPTLNMPFIKKVIDYIESLPSIGRQFRYTMTTNGILLDKYMDFFAEKEFYLMISLDGDEQGQSYRVNSKGENSFSTVVKNIELLRTRYTNYFETHITFNSVIHNRNGVNNAYRFIKQTFGKETGLSPLSTMGVRKDKQQEFNETYRNITNDIKNTPDHEILEKELFISNPKTYWALDYIRKNSGNIFNNYSQLLIDKNKISYPPTATCIPFSKKMFITVKGRILQCEKINHEYCVGTVDDERVNLDLEQVANQHNKHIFRHIKQCKSCATRHNCPICIFEQDDNDATINKCPSYINQEDYRIQCEQQLEYLGQHPEYYHLFLEGVRIQ